MILPDDSGTTDIHEEERHAKRQDNACQQEPYSSVYRVPTQPIVFEVLAVKSDETRTNWDQTVKLWRKLAGLWNAADPDQRRFELRAGCRDALPDFQDYCCRRLANRSGSLPAHVSELLAAPRDELPPARAFQITSNFAQLRQKLSEFSLAAPVAERLRQAGYKNLTFSTRPQG